MQRKLEQQLKQLVKGWDKIPSEWKAFLEAVDDAYEHYEVEKLLLKRSLELTSEELLKMHIAVKEGMSGGGKPGEAQKLLKLLQASLDLAPDGLLLVDAKHRIRFANQPFVRLWMLPPDVLKASEERLVWKFVTPLLKNPEHFVSLIEHVYSRSGEEIDEVLDLRDGRVFEMVSRPQPLEGKKNGRLWCFHDVTTALRHSRPASF